MRKSHMLIGAGIIVLLGTLIWLALPKRIASDSSSQPSAASDVSAARSDAPAAAPPDREPHAVPVRSVVRLSAAERERVASAIRAARQERRSGRGRASDAPASPQTQAAAAQPPAGETLDASHVRAQIGEITPLLAECYERERARVPGLEGDLKLRFTIEGEPEVGGIVSDSQVVGGALAEQPELATCVRETLYTLKLPAPEAGGMVVVDYPFVFASE